MAELTNPYNGKTVNVPESSVDTFKARGFREVKPRATRKKPTKAEE